MFPEGTSASMVLPDGSLQPLTTLDFRATEYTVGENGPEAMPGPLPAVSGYTYAVELSVGEIVPLGYYDRAKGTWVPAPNGRVIKIVGINSGLATISVDPSGSTASQFELDELGITPAEQAELAATYSPGTELWRAQVTHMTPWDCNFPYGPPTDAELPDTDTVEEDELLPDDPCTESGCIIEAEKQVLGERIEIAGTPYTLNYRSSRSNGYRPGRILNLRLSGNTVPPSLLGIEVRISIAGQYITRSFPPAANQTFTWEWDGLDGYGREIRGYRPVSIEIGYLYDLIYYAASDDFAASFARVGRANGIDNGVKIIGNPANRTMELIKQSRATLGNFIPRDDGLGLWTISQHHSYDQSDSTLHLGDGGEVKTDRLGEIITTVAGNGVIGLSGIGGPASESTLGEVKGVIVGPEGSIYISDDGDDTPGISKIDPNGIITRFAGNGSFVASGDGGPATERRGAGKR